MRNSLLQGPGIRSQPLIAARNIRASSRWYQQLLAADELPEHPHRDFYDRLLQQGHLILQLHAWDVENHPNLIDAKAGRPGHGVLLWFEVDDFDATVGRTRSLRLEVIEEPHVNPAQDIGKSGFAIPTDMSSSSRARTAKPVDRRV
jgi:hypothetical protein